MSNVVILREPRYGTITWNGIEYDYTPNINFSGVDSFIYSQIINGQTKIFLKTVDTNNLNPPPPPPPPPTEAVITIPPTVSIIKKPLYGSISWNGINFDYISNSSVIGNDFYTYSQIVNGTSVIYTKNVNQNNSAPTTSNLYLTATPFIVKTINISDIASDSSNPFNYFKITNVIASDTGKVETNGSDIFYTANKNNFLEYVTYTVSDNQYQSTGTLAISAIAEELIIPYNPTPLQQIYDNLDFIGRANASIPKWSGSTNIISTYKDSWDVVDYVRYTNFSRTVENRLSAWDNIYNDISKNYGTYTILCSYSAKWNDDKDAINFYEYPILNFIQKSDSVYNTLKTNSANWYNSISSFNSLTEHLFDYQPKYDSVLATVNSKVEFWDTTELNSFTGRYFNLLQNVYNSVSSISSDILNHFINNYSDISSQVCTITSYADSCYNTVCANSSKTWNQDDLNYIKNNFFDYWNSANYIINRSVVYNDFTKIINDYILEYNNLQPYFNGVFSLVNTNSASNWGSTDFYTNLLSSNSGYWNSSISSLNDNLCSWNTTWTISSDIDYVKPKFNELLNLVSTASSSNWRTKQFYTNLLSAVSTNWVSSDTNLNDNISTWNTTWTISSDIDAVTPTFNQLLNLVSTISSPDWVSTDFYTNLLSSNSGYWNDAYTSLNLLSTDWYLATTSLSVLEDSSKIFFNTLSTVSSVSSSNWNSTDFYTNLLSSNSGNWVSSDTNLNDNISTWNTTWTISSDIEAVKPSFNQLLNVVSSTSGSNWNSTDFYTNLLSSNSGYWNDAYTSLNLLSTDWYLATTSLSVLEDSGKIFFNTLSTVSANSASNWGSTDFYTNLLSSNSGYWESSNTNLNDNISTWNTTWTISSDIEAVKPSFNNLLNVVSTTSGSNWGSTDFYTNLLSSNSGYWNDAYTSLNLLSTDWYLATTSLSVLTDLTKLLNNTLSTVSSNSASNWGSTDFYINILSSNSGYWYSSDSTLSDNLCAWNTTRTLSSVIDAVKPSFNQLLNVVSSNSASNWNDTDFYTNLLSSNSGYWNDVYTSLNLLSTDWYSVSGKITSINDTFKYFYNVLSTVSTTSASNWNKNNFYTNLLSSNSGNWENSVSLLCSKYVDWNFAANSLGSIGNYINLFNNTLSTVSANYLSIWDNTNILNISASNSNKWDNVYNTLTTNSGDWYNLSGYITKQSNTQNNIISLTNTVSTNSASYWNASSISNLLNSNTGYWDNTYNLVLSTSSNWDRTSKSLNYLSGIGASYNTVYNTTCSVSGGLWDTSYIENFLRPNSSYWTQSYNTLTANSGDWRLLNGLKNTISGIFTKINSTYNTVSINSSLKWDNTDLTILLSSNSSYWQDTFNTFKNVSSSWYSISSLNNRLSSLESLLINTTNNVSTNSALNWDNINLINILSSNSGYWNSAYNTLSNISSNWYAISGLSDRINNINTILIDNTNTVSSTSASNWNTTSFYTNLVSSNSSNWQSANNNLTSFSGSWYSISALNITLSSIESKLIDNTNTVSSTSASNWNTTSFYTNLVSSNSSNWQSATNNLSSNSNAWYSISTLINNLSSKESLLISNTNTVSSTSASNWNTTSFYTNLVSSNSSNWQSANNNLTSFSGSWYSISALSDTINNIGLKLINNTNIVSSNSASNWGTTDFYTNLLSSNSGNWEFTNNIISNTSGSWYNISNLSNSISTSESLLISNTNTVSSNSASNWNHKNIENTLSSNSGYWKSANDTITNNYDKWYNLNSSISGISSLESLLIYNTNTVSANSALNWGSTDFYINLISSNSGYWNSANTTLGNFSGDWYTISASNNKISAVEVLLISNTNTVSSNSASNWGTTGFYTNLVSSNSGYWNSANTTLINASGNWYLLSALSVKLNRLETLLLDNTNTVSSNSASNWGTTEFYTNLLSSNSGYWNLANNNLITFSADWYALDESIKILSASESKLIDNTNTVSSNSASNWGTTEFYTNLLSSNSGYWKSANTNLTSFSGDWYAIQDLSNNINNTELMLINNYNTVSSNSASNWGTTGFYTSLLSSNSGNWYNTNTAIYYDDVTIKRYPLSLSLDPIRKNGYTYTGTKTVSNDGPYGMNALRIRPLNESYQSFIYSPSDYSDGLSIINLLLPFNIDWTIEFYINVISGDGLIIGQSPGQNDAILLTNKSLHFRPSIGSTAGTTINFTTPIPVNTWTHVALTHTSVGYRVYTNGALQCSYGNRGYPSNSPFYIGDTGIDFKIANLRITKNVGLYDGDFSKPVNYLTQDSNTSVLFTKFDVITDYVYDATVSNPQNYPSISNISPFANDTSIYANAYSQYSIQKEACNINGIVDFTAECWFYISDTDPNNYYPIFSYQYAADKNGLMVVIQSGNIILSIAPTLGNWAYVLTSPYSFTLRQWYHVAITRESGSTYKLFLDGNKVAEATSTEPITDTGLSSPYSWRLGANTAYSASRLYKPFVGNISNFRVTKGVALYTNNFTKLANSFQIVQPYNSILINSPMTTVNGINYYKRYGDYFGVDNIRSFTDQAYNWYTLNQSITTVNNIFSRLISNTNTVSSNSASNWGTTGFYTNLLSSNSGYWESAYNNLTSFSGDWYNTDLVSKSISSTELLLLDNTNTVSSNSASNWGTTDFYTNLLSSNSGYWNSAGTSLTNTSGNWYLLSALSDKLSGIENILISNTTTVSSNSALKWDNTELTNLLSSNSSYWESAYSTITSFSADWYVLGELNANINKTISKVISNTNTVSSNSASNWGTTDFYTNLLSSNSGNWNSTNTTLCSISTDFYNNNHRLNVIKKLNSNSTEWNSLVCSKSAVSWNVDNSVSLLSSITSKYQDFYNTVQLFSSDWSLTNKILTGFYYKSNYLIYNRLNDFVNRNLFYWNNLQEYTNLISNISSYNISLTNNLYNNNLYSYETPRLTAYNSFLKTNSAKLISNYNYITTTGYGWSGAFSNVSNLSTQFLQGSGTLSFYSNNLSAYGNSLLQNLTVYGVRSNNYTTTYVLPFLRVYNSDYYNAFQISKNNIIGNLATFSAKNYGRIMSITTNNGVLINTLNKDSNNALTVSGNISASGYITYSYMDMQYNAFSGVSANYENAYTFATSQSGKLDEYKLSTQYYDVFYNYYVLSSVKTNNLNYFKLTYDSIIDQNRINGILTEFIANSTANVGIDTAYRTLSSRYENAYSALTAISAKPFNLIYTFAYPSSLVATPVISRMIAPCNLIIDSCTITSDNTSDIIIDVLEGYLDDGGNYVDTSLTYEGYFVNYNTNKSYFKIDSSGGNNVIAKDNVISIQLKNNTSSSSIMVNLKCYKN